MAGGSGRLRLLARLATGRARVHHFIVVSHHFMSRAEIETALGQERLHHCVFRVPIGEQMVAMCEVNALGARERLYHNLERLAVRGESHTTTDC